MKWAFRTGIPQSVRENPKHPLTDHLNAGADAVFWNGGWIL